MIHIQSFPKSHSRIIFAVALVVLWTLPLILPFKIEAQQRGKRYSINFVNNSRVRIDRIYISHTYETGWGEDLLGKYYLQPGQSYNITLVAGEYDIKLVDEDADKCVVNDVLISQDTSWGITNSWLKQCVGRTTQ